MLARIGTLALVALACCGAPYDQDPPPAAPQAAADAPPAPPPPPAQPPPDAPPPPAQPPPDAQASTSPPPAPNAPPPPAAPPSVAPADVGQEGQEAPPAPAQWQYTYPTGQWVYTAGYGWVWVPAGTATQAMEGVPYAYLYSPAAGWNWYVSPWGWGPYRYGVWVRHPWAPAGWRYGWAARPRVFVRLGGHRRWR